MNRKRRRKRRGRNRKRKIKKTRRIKEKERNFRKDEEQGGGKVGGTLASEYYIWI